MCIFTILMCDSNILYGQLKTNKKQSAEHSNNSFLFFEIIIAIIVHRRQNVFSMSFICTSAKYIRPKKAKLDVTIIVKHLPSTIKY